MADSPTPWFQGEMRGSLVLSMLQQMVTDDKAEEVREAAVRSLGLLMGFVDDQHKFNQVLTTSIPTYHYLKDIS
jgi:hypothetical protein